MHIESVNTSASICPFFYGNAPLTAACSAHLKKTISTSTRLASLPHVEFDYQPSSPTRCSAQLLTPGFGTRLPTSHGGAVAGLARRAAAYRPCQAQRDTAASLPRRAATASLPCRAATAEPLPTSTVGLLSPANSKCRRASILLSSKEMFALKLHVASVYFKCFKCLRNMLQVFYTDTTKVDRDVTHVAMVVHVCCKLVFSMFYLFFSTYVASVFIWMLHMFSHIRCKCFIWILRIFTMVFRCFYKCFKRMFHLFSDICCI
jgi:hypothetical protein